MHAADCDAESFCESDLLEINSRHLSAMTVVQCEATEKEKPLLPPNPLTPDQLQSLVD